MKNKEFIKRALAENPEILKDLSEDRPGSMTREQYDAFNPYGNPEFFANLVKKASSVPDHPLTQLVKKLGLEEAQLWMQGIIEARDELTREKKKKEIKIPQDISGKSGSGKTNLPK